MNYEKLNLGKLPVFFSYRNFCTEIGGYKNLLLWLIKITIKKKRLLKTNGIHSGNQIFPNNVFLADFKSWNL